MHKYSIYAVLSQIWNCRKSRFFGANFFWGKNWSVLIFTPFATRSSHVIFCHPPPSPPQVITSFMTSPLSETLQKFWKADYILSEMFFKNMKWYELSIWSSEEKKVWKDEQIWSEVLNYNGTLSPSHHVKRGPPQRWAQQNHFLRQRQRCSKSPQA